MPQTSECSAEQMQTVEEVLHRVAGNLSLLMDHEILIDDVDVSCWDERPAGEGQVHISFKLRFARGEQSTWGCLLLPLPEALTLTGYLMMVSSEAVDELRGQDRPEPAEKDAMLEIANFIGSAVDAAIQDSGIVGVSVHADGCQGVRADVRPAFEYQEGSPLVVGRATMRIHEYPAFTALSMIPDLDAV